MMDRCYIAGTVTLGIGLGIFALLTRGTGQELGPPRNSAPGAPSPAAIPRSPLPPLTIYDAARISMERHPVLRQATFNIQAAQGRADQAGRYPNPVVSIIGDEMSDRQGPGGIITVPQISQEIVLGGKLGLSQVVAQAELHQASLSLQGQRF